MQIQPFLTAAGVSSALFFYSTGFYDYWLLTWLAPLPVCLYALQSSAKKAALAGFIAYFVGAMNQFGYLPLLTFWGSTSLNSIAFAVVVMLFRCMAASKSKSAAPFVFASSWTSYEFIRSLLSSYGTFESLAYTQVLNLPIIQVAPLTGIWGITFLLMLLPATLAIVRHFRCSLTAYRTTVLLTGSLFLIVISWGCVRLYTSVATPSLKIGLAAVSTAIERLRAQDAENIAATLHDYSSSVDMLAGSGAQVVLLPEKIAALSLKTRQPGLAALSDAAHKNNIMVIAGLSSHEDKLYNAAFLFSPAGSLLPSYHKQHLLPAYEKDYTPGTGLVLFQLTNTTTGGIAICKDMDFVQPAREYSRQGVGILFVPALDFHEDGWLHARIAIMRGVEGNYTVARSAQWGLLTVSDSRGRILGLTSTDTASGKASLLSEVPLSSGQSFYSFTGDWFAWLCILISSTAVIVLIGRKE